MTWRSMLPEDLSGAHVLALGLLMACWFGYGPALALFGRGSLNAQLGIVRRHWIAGATRRVAKPFDAILLGHIVHAVAFFGSATLIVLAGLIGAFTNAKGIHGTVRDLHVAGQVSLELFMLELAFLAFVMAVCFFSFTYALRKLIYALALVGALPDKADGCATIDQMVGSATLVLSESIKSFNFGIRGYYYAVAALCLFVSPAACIAATLLVTAILLYRQLLTPTSRAIQAYVEAAKALDP